MPKLKNQKSNNDNSGAPVLDTSNYPINENVTYANRTVFLEDIHVFDPDTSVNELTEVINKIRVI
jgi:hypothetical protein